MFANPVFGHCKTQTVDYRFFSLFVEKWEVTIIHHVIVKQHQYSHVQVYLRSLL